VPECYFIRICVYNLEFFELKPKAEMQNINIIEGFLILFRQCNRLLIKENDSNKPIFMLIILTKGRKN